MLAIHVHTHPVAHVAMVGKQKHVLHTCLCVKGV